MQRETRNAAIAALIVLLFFSLAGFYLPKVMLALGQVSPVLAGIFAVLFVLAFFLIFWLRGRQRRNGGN